MVDSLYCVGDIVEVELPFETDSFLGKVIQVGLENDSFVGTKYEGLASRIPELYKAYVVERYSNKKRYLVPMEPRNRFSGRIVMKYGVECYDGFEFLVTEK